MLGKVRQHMSRFAFAFAAAVVGALASVAMAQAPKSISYESLCKLDKSGPRRVAWMSTTAESRAETTKTQVIRFREVYRGGLTSGQYAHIAELLAAITPEVYTDGPTHLSLPVVTCRRAYLMIVATSTSNLRKFW